MKLSRRWPLLLCVVTMTSAFALADPVVPELRGMLATGKDRRFALSIPGGDTAWVGIGGKFAGWTLKEFNAAEDVVVLVKDGQETRLKLSSSKIGEADVKATLADAEAVMDKMKFEEMFAKIMDQQKKSVVEMMRSTTGKMKGVDAADLAAFQTKVMDVMFTEMKPEEMKADVTQIYSEVFTKAELKGLGAFYDTAAGQAMIDKQPEIQKRMTELMMPRMMLGMAKIGPLSAEFAKQQAEKKKAATAAAAAVPATTQ
jgi:uncharacterized protein